MSALLNGGVSVGWRFVGFLYIASALYFVFCFWRISQYYQASHTWSTKRNVHPVKGPADVYDIVVSGPLREAHAKSAGQVADKSRELLNKEHTSKQGSKQTNSSATRHDRAILQTELPVAH